MIHPEAPNHMLPRELTRHLFLLLVATEEDLLDLADDLLARCYPQPIAAQQ